jgi:phosphatidylserine decarboxylase
VVSASTFAAAQLIRALPRVHLSRAVGKLCESPLPGTVSRAVQRAYCAAYDVKMEEAAPESGPYVSFDAFFTRKLREGARPLDADPILSPSDGKLSCHGPIDSASRIFVKGQAYDVGELAGDSKDAIRYRGGQFAVIYLAPSDYHRVHSPVDGVVNLVRGIPGDLYPVNSIGEKYVPQLFVRNNRVNICVDSEQYGRVSVIMVGATIVGRISVSMIAEPAVPPGETRLESPYPVARGDELGIFHLGSTAVLLFEPGVTLRRELGKVRMGQSLLKDA